MLGDAPIIWEAAIFLNVVFWILMVIVAYFIYNKVFEKRNKHIEK